MTVSAHCNQARLFFGPDSAPWPLPPRLKTHMRGSSANRCRLPPPPAGDGMPVWGVRGGGGRGRQDGQGSGRHKGLDPVVPFTDEETLQSIQDFYGLLPEFPLWEQMIHRSELCLQCLPMGPTHV